MLSVAGRYVRQNAVIRVRDTGRRKIQYGSRGKRYGGELGQPDPGYRRSAAGEQRSFVDHDLVGRWIMFKKFVKEYGQ